jgi:ATP-dependent Clp protease protease subunit
MGGTDGQASDIEISTRQIVTLKKELYDIIALHTGQDYKRVLKDADRDYWMTSIEAKNYGMIDEILEKK